MLVIDIKGAIGFVSAGQLAKALERAAAQGAPAVIVRLDTPGGLLSSTREMIQAILASRVPVVMYVAPNGSPAASAGTYLLYASHVAAMAPSTHLGAATPIPLSPPGMPGSPPPSKPRPRDRTSRADVRPGQSVSAAQGLNDAIAYIRSLAELRGRNADWGEKAVRDAATLTASAALKERVIDVDRQGRRRPAGADRRAHGHDRGRRGAARDQGARRRRDASRTGRCSCMSAIADPNIALILLMIGIYGILFEFWSPGAVAPGVIGGICLIVALTALSVLPVNYGGLALLMLGIALMVAEAFTAELRHRRARRHRRLRARRPVPVRSRPVRHPDPASPGRWSPAWRSLSAAFFIGRPGLCRCGRAAARCARGPRR